MNILLINHYAGSDNHGMEFRPYYMAKEWIKLGHNVTIICSDYSHLRKINPDFNYLFKEEIIDGINYIWFKTLKYKGNGIRRALNIFLFVFRIFQSANYLINRYKPDIVIASSTFLFDIFPAKYIANKTKAKLIYEIHDLWPLSPIELGGMSKYNPFIIALQFAEDYSYRFSDLVVSMLPLVAEHTKEHGLDNRKLFIVENGIIIEDKKGAGFDNNNLETNLTQKIDTLKKQGQFVCAYCGNHGIANALYTLLDAAKLVENKNITILLIGQGPEKNKLIEYAKKKKINNVIFHDAVKKNELMTLLNSFDCLYIGLQKQPLFRYGISPNKLIDYMYSGRPIIQAIEAGNDMVGEAKCGLSIEAENPTELAKALIKMQSMTETERQLLGQNGYKYVKNNRDYKKLAKKFLKIMEETIK